MGLPLICCIGFIGSKFSVSNHVINEKPKPTLDSFSKRPEQIPSFTPTSLTAIHHPA